MAKVPYILKRNTKAVNPSVYCRDGHRVNSQLVEQTGFGGIEELAGEE